MGVAVPASVRFWRHVEVTADPDACWLWTGNTGGTKSLYGYFRHTTRASDPKILAHRFAFEQEYGPVPAGHEVDHLCGQPLCVNARHLEAVEPDENSRRTRLARCKRDHDLTDERNVTFDNQGRRRGCAVCNRMTALAYYHRRAAANV